MICSPTVEPGLHHSPQKIWRTLQSARRRERGPSGGDVRGAGGHLAAQKAPINKQQGHYTFTRRLVEARNVIERRPLNVLNLYSRETEWQAREREGEGGQKTTKKTKKQQSTDTDTLVSATLQFITHTVGAVVRARTQQT